MGRKKFFISVVFPLLLLAGHFTTLPVHGAIYVGSFSGNNIPTFPLNANGDVAPTRTISGPATALAGPRAIALDPAPPVLSSSVPTLTEWGMIILIILLGIGSFHYLRRPRLTA